MEDIKEIRNEIDIIDNQIIELLAKRLSLMPQVIKYKKENNTSC
jgi:chorismate mutase